MNIVVICGRATRTPEFKDGEHPYVRFSLAVDRRGDGADFINCVAFGKTAESVYKWVQKGTKIIVDGRIQTGSYENRDGKRVNTFDVVVNNWEFAQSKGESPAEVRETTADGFMQRTEDDLADENLPFN